VGFGCVVWYVGVYEYFVYGFFILVGWGWVGFECRLWMMVVLCGGRCILGLMLLLVSRLSLVVRMIVCGLLLWLSVNVKLVFGL